MKNSNQLKSLIRNYSNKSNVSAQVLLRNYMHECFLERVSLSRYIKLSRVKWYAHEELSR